MTPEEREQMEQMREIWRNAQSQLQAEKTRQGTTDPATPKQAAGFIQKQRDHVQRLWEEGGRLKRGDGDSEMACETCKGARFVSRRDAMPPTTMPCPDCWRPWYAARIRRNWRLTEKEYALGKKPFRRRHDAPQMAGAYKAMKDYAARVVAGTADMFAITGTVGIGKTHLLLTLHRLVDEANCPVIYRTATHIQGILQDFGGSDEAKREKGEHRARAMNDMLKVSLLILDEAEKGIAIGDNGKGEWFCNQMLDLINARRNRGLATALAGNNLYRMPAPIVSRAQAQGCIFLVCDGIPDARPDLELVK